MPRVIRASMLPAWPDCPRRGAARQYKKEIEAAGFTLRKILPSIGAAVGTAVHAWLGARLRWTLNKEETIDTEAPMNAFREEIAPGAEWDATTPNIAVAEHQIARMAKAFVHAGV